MVQLLLPRSLGPDSNAISSVKPVVTPPFPLPSQPWSYLIACGQVAWEGGPSHCGWGQGSPRDLGSNTDSAFTSGVNLSPLSLVIFVIYKMETDKIRFVYMKQKTQIRWLKEIRGIFLS